MRQAGPAENQIVKRLDELIDEYYEAAGYTKEGIPTAEKLKALGIEELIGGALRK